MPNTGPCPKCGGAMAEGFIKDVGYGTQAPSSWIEGAPVRSIWNGVKLTAARGIKSPRSRAIAAALEYYAR